jgi:hypothetical protein
MQKQLGILIALILIGIGGYYVFTERVAEIPAPVATTTPVSEPDVSSDDYDQSLYVLEIDPKLHISKEVTLDPKIITINKELKDVALCGNTYKTKQVLIDGVDVVQRLSQFLATDQEKNDWYCKMLIEWTQLSSTPAMNDLLSPGEEIHIYIATDGRHYSFAPHIGAKWAGGGYPVYAIVEENRLQGHVGVPLGTLR